MEGPVKRWMGLLVGSAAIITTSCSSSGPTTVSAAPATAMTTTAQPAVHEGGSLYQASGPLVVENQVDVAAQREGVIARIHADVGTHVHKGQVLAELEDRQLTADRD